MYVLFLIYSKSDIKKNKKDVMYPIWQVTYQTTSPSQHFATYQLTAEVATLYLTSLWLQNKLPSVSLPFTNIILTSLALFPTQVYYINDSYSYHTFLQMY